MAPLSKLLLVVMLAIPATTVALPVELKASFATIGSEASARDVAFDKREDPKKGPYRTVYINNYEEEHDIGSEASVLDLAFHKRGDPKKGPYRTVYINNYEEEHD